MLQNNHHLSFKIVIVLNLTAINDKILSYVKKKIGKMLKIQNNFLNKYKEETVSLEINFL